MKAVILAAGRGTRMKALTENMPKPMLAINGKPFLHYLIDNLRKAGFTDIAVVVCYRKDVIGSWVADNEIDVTLIEQGEPQGTGDAVLHAKEWAGGEGFIVVMGDNLYSPRDLKALASTDEYCYIAGARDLEQTKLAAIISDGDFLVNVIEKPPKKMSELSNVGMYKFTPAVFDALAKIGKSPRGEYEITDAIALLAESRKMKVFVLKDYWIDLTTPDDIKKIERFLKGD